MSSSLPPKKEEALIPPLNPYSPQEIQKFSPLDLALRSLPEFAREGATILNPKALARLVQGMKMFQDAHFGRLETSRYFTTKNYPMMKLPDEFFRMRSSTGPLFTMIMSAYRQKKESSWRQFDFTSKNRYQDNVKLMKRIEKDLIAAGHLKRPVVYFDESIPKGNLSEYRKTIKKYGGRTVKDILNPDVTHVVAWDEEEHDSPETLEQEHLMGDHVQKLYLRTLTVVDPKMKKSGGIIETTMQDSKKKGGKVKGAKGTATVVYEHPMAYVHWWYHPSSYDEWMAATDVSGADTDVAPRPLNGPWIVGCKFIRDVPKFNEWGLESDYAISDYEKKVTSYPRLEKKLLEEAKAKEAAKPTTLKIRLNLSSSSSQASKAKKQKKEDKEEKIEKPNEEAKKKRKVEPTGPSGMEPRQILTGFYNDTGSRIKQTVFDGALRVPKIPIQFVREAIKDVVPSALKGIDSTFKLPDVHTMLRPSLDPLYASNFLVTELRAGSNGSTIVTARRTNNGPAAITAGGAMTPRIRGGGSNDGDGDVEMEDASNPAKVPAPQDPPVANNPVVPASAPTQAIVAQATKSQIAPQVTNPKSESDTSFQSAPKTHQSNIAQSAPPQATPSQVEQAPVQTNPVQTNGSNETITSPQDVQTTQVSLLPQATPVQAAAPLAVSEQAAVPQTTITQTVITKTPSTQTTDVLKTTPTQVSIAPALSKGADTSQKNSAQAVPPTSSSASVSTSAEKKPIPEPTQSTSLPTGGINIQTVVSSSKGTPASSSANFPSSEPKAENTLSSTVSAPVLKETNGAPIKQTLPNVATIKPLPNEPESKDSKRSLVGEQEPTIELPSWYDTKNVSNLEKSLLPEWFDESAEHRTEATYIVARERIIDLARNSSTKYLTSTAVRRCVAGDAGSIIRLHNFLVTWGFINGSAVGESAPLQVTKADAPKQNKQNNLPVVEWTTEMTQTLAVAVAKSTTRKRKIDDLSGEKMEIDWDSVAKMVGVGMSATQCYQKFLTTNFNEVRGEQSNVQVVNLSPTTEDTSREDLIGELIDGVKPQTARTVIDVALKASGGDVDEAQKASVLGIVASKALERAREEEDATSRILQEILDQRMKKLENRLSLLDDLEGMLDAERMALELERRDLYTNRCRHWLNGDT